MPRGRKIWVAHVGSPEIIRSIDTYLPHYWASQPSNCPLHCKLARWTNHICSF